MQPKTETQTFRIEIRPRATTSPDAAGARYVAAAAELVGVRLTACRVVRLVHLQGALTSDDAARLATDLLADPVTETVTVMALAPDGAPLDASVPTDHTHADSTHAIEVMPLPGVTDPPAENLLRAAPIVGVTGLQRAATGSRFEFDLAAAEDADDAHLQLLATQVFSNPVIQQATVDAPIAPPFRTPAPPERLVETVAVRDLDDADLVALSVRRRLALDLAEMRAIQAHFRDAGREPTDAELETLAQAWSEHCIHKTFKAVIDYTGPRPGPLATPLATPDAAQSVEQHINGLLRTYIMAATNTVAKPWVHSAFVDNAGIVAFDDAYDLAFKVETHNHPSALEPFGGANTGVGGVVRDVLGVSARPIANTDILCFGPPDLPREQLPAGVLHPHHIAEGVVAGIEDYGNKMGIPTVSGALLFDRGYTANPLVFCGCLGILPHGAHVTEPHAGDLIVLIGGRTGRDGLGGATFSSMEMDAETSTVASGAVQIGHPIHEKQVQEVLLRARDAHLYSAVTDCGAGGISSAVTEMGRAIGAHVHLEIVPLKYAGLRPWEIWLSEAQERMVFAVPPEHWGAFQAICSGQDVEAVAIGAFEATGALRLTYGDTFVADLPMAFVHDGLPRKHLRAEWAPPASTDTHASRAVLTAASGDRHILESLLAQPAIRSKEDILRRYDHEVQGGTAVKPLVGVDAHGPSDAAVLVPFEASTPAGGQPPRGVALSVGVCPSYGALDPYAMAFAAVDEAFRNAVAVGADPDQVSLLDNFCWGNATLPDRLGSLVRCAQGCHDAAVTYGAPFISGKDSLNNEYMGEDGQRHAIPGTLVISALGIVPDVAHTVTMDLKAEGDYLYLIGETRNELGGSALATAHGSTGGIPPQPIENPLARYRALHQAMRQGLVQACHDCSEGGLGVALAEMCIAGRRGAHVSLVNVPGGDDLTPIELLYSESAGRLVCEVRPEDAAAFEAALAGVPCARVGYVTSDDLRQSTLAIDYDVERLLSLSVSALEAAWRGATQKDEFAAITATPGALRFRGERGERSAATSATTHSPLPQRGGGVGGGGPHHSKRVLILHANGTNRDHDAARACELAGGAPEIVHVNQLLSGERHLADYAMLVVPGGFSYGDDLGAGTLWALDLRARLAEDIGAFIRSGRPVLGICNGFQVLVKAGLLPGYEPPTGASAAARAVTLAPNASALFECRWVYLQSNPASACLFTEGLEDLIACPVAHGEGRIVTASPEATARLERTGLIALTYVDASGAPTTYPANPNGSALGIAGLTNPAGNVLGLMPHPEDHIFPWQAPWPERGQRYSGLPLFTNGLRRA